MRLTLGMAICGTLIMGNVINADTITSKGIKEYNGTFTDEAFAWTESDGDDVNATVVRTSNWSVIVTTSDTDGYVQNPQTSYSSTSVMGMHLAGTGSRASTGRSWP